MNLSRRDFGRAVGAGIMAASLPVSSKELKDCADKALARITSGVVVLGSSEMESAFGFLQLIQKSDKPFKT